MASFYLVVIVENFVLFAGVVLCCSKYLELYYCRAFVSSSDV